ncbi:MAG: NAD-glutamate dehydrogenase [Proteobacteria bacterium]|nr:NAD-glutamate dehydrogenase [Pseudomonadota bacterium]
MPKDADLQKKDLIGKAASEGRKRLGKNAQSRFRHFFRSYYANVPPQDILGSAAAALFGLAHGHWKQGQTRKRGRPNIRVFNPDPKKDGWQSPHTIIEIVTDDMPFLVDSVTAELNRCNLTVHLVIHPVLTVARDQTGKLLDIIETGQSRKGTLNESFMHLQVAQLSGARLKEIETGLKNVLGDVRAAVQDWSTMRDLMLSVINELDVAPKGVHPEEAAEIREFLRWIHDNQFTFLGYRDYDFKGSGKKARVAVGKLSGLGLMRDPGLVVFKEMRDVQSASREVQDFISAPDLLMVLKTNRQSTVHRPVHMDAIGIKKLDSRGRAVGLRLFVGLFTSAAYSRSPRDIPLLRRRLEKTVERAGFPSSSHDGKALMHILENYPRDELFQVSDDDLLKTSLGILHLQDRQRVALFLRRDDFERFISCMIFVPRDRYTTVLRRTFQDILSGAFAGEVATHYAQLGESPLARLHLIIRTTPGKIPAYDIHELEARLLEAARSWTDSLSDALVAARGEEKGRGLLDRYADAFGPGYREDYDINQTIQDIDRIEDLLETGGIGMNLYHPPGATPSQVRFKVFHPDTPVPLSSVLPLFEHMGFNVVDEVPHDVDLRSDLDRTVMIHDFGLESKDAAAVNVDAIRDNFQDAFRRVWHGDIESDGFNTLVPGAGLTWREVVILRAYAKYLRQTGIPFSQAYMEQTLAGNGAITGQIVKLFLTRFDPAGKGRDGAANRIVKRILSQFESVVSADEDRILRRFLNAVESTLRTNYFQKDGNGDAKPYLSFKLDSKALDDLPLPRPLREIFVYSPRVEGIHLRCGMVARGGLRWSDRPEDFRTEVLGLVKAQQVKNAVIVPVGSKGGFVVKQPPKEGGRDAFIAEGIECYKILISGLLDLTDNYQGTRVTQPKNVVRRDADDPYLVVAADKGTATFSDIANGVSEEYGHWLGDAFASGGSQGYDHKGMGITAKGAWESVKRHFREIGTDIQKQDFTVVGVGDMSGDVFGNGMLLSRHIRLVGAFNHMHIFVDPDPDTEKSLKERQRLFKLPRSAWTDYDKKLISKGGAIYERSAKSLTLSPEVRALFGIAKDKVTPNELMRLMLSAEVDLLWFGGIGTYIKATHESDQDVGDRATDAIRINGGDVRAAVLGEGANLGTTQLGRVEYALNGGRLNTDSIDNSAGVDCSDHEVNIKILIDSVVDKGGLSMPQRNKLLASMTHEVGQLVLRHNYLQSQAISMIEAKGVETLDNQIRLMRMLERADRLDRDVERLPNDEMLEERALTKRGLTRPEIAIVMSYSKIWLYDELLASDLPDDPKLEEDLLEYFPTPLRVKYRKEIGRHRLSREIIATRVTNSMVNRVGGTFATEFMEKTGKSASEIARAYTIAREVFQLRGLWDAIEKLDNNIPAAVQAGMLLDINHLLDWVTLWFLRNGEVGLDIGSHVREFQKGIEVLSDNLKDALPAHYMKDVKKRALPYMDKGVPEALALQIANLVNLYSACDIVRLANRRKSPVPDVARTYFAIGTRFRLGRLRASAEHLSAEGHWQKLAVAALVEEIYGHQLSLARQVLDFAGKPGGKPGGKGKDIGKTIAAWTDKNAAAVGPTEQLLTELWATEINDLAMIAVASRSLRAMADQGS